MEASSSRTETLTTPCPDERSTRLKTQDGIVAFPSALNSKVCVHGGEVRVAIIVSKSFLECQRPCMNSLKGHDSRGVTMTTTRLSAFVDGV